MKTPNIDRLAAEGLAQEHPDIVERLSKMAKEWQATLPGRATPSCISTADRGKAKPPGKKRAKK